MKPIVSMMATRCLLGGAIFADEPAKPKGLPKPEDKFVGTWKGSVDGYDQFWTIANENGTWSVRGTFKHSGKEAGSFLGTDVKYADNSLTFTRKFVKKPAGTDWADDVPIVVKAESDGLTYAHASSGAKGVRALVRYADAPKPAAKGIEPFLGSWEGRVDKLKTVWEISVKDDKIQVNNTYYAQNSKTGAWVETGSWVGVDISIKDGKLVFSNKVIKKPDTSYKDMATMTCKVVNENTMEYTVARDGRTVHTITMTRVKK
jgi:hypothetical protein